MLCLILIFVNYISLQRLMFSGIYSTNCWSASFREMILWCKYWRSDRWLLPKQRERERERVWITKILVVIVPHSMHCNYSDGLHTSGNQSIPITMVNLFNLELECFSELFRIQFQSFCLHHAVYPIPPILLYDYGNQRCAVSMLGSLGGLLYLIYWHRID